MILTKRQQQLVSVAVASTVFHAPSIRAVTIVFFNDSQTASVVATNMASTTISSSGYLFTYSLDQWWYPTISLGPGTPTGRFVSVNWPNGVNAQTITAAPSGLLASQIAASIIIQRVDGKSFDLASFTARILGNTAGAGASFEIMPQLSGNDGFANPLTFDATGIAGNSFTYNTPMLTGFDTYNVSLWMDFALTGLTLVDASLPPPSLQITLTNPNYVRLLWPTNSAGFVLQQNSDLGAANWVSATDAVSVAGTNYQVMAPATNHMHFFRLMR